MTTSQKPPLTLSLVWEGDLRFTGTSGHTSMVLDSPGRAGPSPMQALAFGLAGCMAMDLVSILAKGRHPVEALEATLAGRRADGQPARFVAVELRYTITGDVPPAAIERAIALSREKYCSVWHSMRQDIDFTITYETRAAARVEG
jgi:putative redox protein